MTFTLKGGADGAERAGIKKFRASKEMGINESVMRKWLNGDTQPGGENLLKLAEYFDVSPEWLQTGQGGPSSFRPAVQTPVLGKVPAGFPENLPQEEILEYITLPDLPRSAYALIVKGDSMSPKISEGDYVIFIPTADVKPGDVVIALNEWGDHFIKRFRIKEGKKYLSSDNPAYKPIEPNKHFRIIGKIIDIWSRKKP